MSTFLSASCRVIAVVYVVTVDKLEQMLGSYGPHPKGEAYTKNFDPEESPSGMLARSGTYNVRSRVIDDDGEVYAGKCSAMCCFSLCSPVCLRLGLVFQAVEGVVMRFCDWGWHSICISFIIAHYTTWSLVVLRRQRSRAVHEYVIMKSQVVQPTLVASHIESDSRYA